MVNVCLFIAGLTIGECAQGKQAQDEGKRYEDDVSFGEGLHGSLLVRGSGMGTAFEVRLWSSNMYSSWLLANRPWLKYAES
jgi:hypothetical protein